jgi:cytochrome c oxidase assembly factor CtaG
MFNLLFADRFNLWHVDLWYAVPIIVAVSLVYSATRHEQMRPILVHAGRVAVWIAGFMLAVFVVVEFVSWLI